MTLVRWQPRHQMVWGLQRDINRMFDNTVSPRWSRYMERDWTPDVDVEELENEFVVSVDLPGVDKKDVKVTIENNLLTIKGERRVEATEEEEGRYHCSERCYGSFQRSFSLPRTVDSSRINAKHTDGVLTITLPKAEEAKEREIEVQVK